MVLFDIDGTLVDTGGAGRRALERLFEIDYQIADSYSGYSFTGRTDLRILRDGWRRHLGREATAAEIERARTRYLELLDEELAATPRSRMRVMPGVVELVTRLQATGIPVGLATGNIIDGARRKLEATGLWHLFPFGGFGSDHELRAELTRIGIERGRRWAGREIPADRVLVVGDSPLDIAAARDNGAVAVGVLTGWDSRETMAACSPDHLLDDLADVEGFMRLVA